MHDAVNHASPRASGTPRVARIRRVAADWTRARIRLATASFRAVPPELDNECARSYVLSGAPRRLRGRDSDRQPDIIAKLPFPVLARLRGPSWRRLGLWFRGVGLSLIVFVVLAPLPAVAITALAAPGLVMLTVGALAWLARDTESWRR